MYICLYVKNYDKIILGNIYNFLTPLLMRWHFSGTYVLMIEDVTDPPFLGETLPTLFTLIEVKKKKREITKAPKEKGPK